MTRPTRRVPLPVAALLLLAFLVTAVTAIVLGVQLARDRAGDRAGAEALATASAYAVTVTTYDYRTIDRSFTDVLDGATGEFRTQYDGASRSLRQLITDAHSSSQGRLLEVGIKSADPGRVVVLAFVDQHITNAGGQKIDRIRLVMTLIPHDGRWLVEKLELT